VSDHELRDFRVGDLVWADGWNPKAPYPRVRRVMGHGFLLIESPYEIRTVSEFQVYRVDPIDALASLA